ncbi:MAG: hypothetical protein AAB573_03155 [Patescibacteria group bacterium]
MRRERHNEFGPVARRLKALDTYLGETRKGMALTIALGALLAAAVLLAPAAIPGTFVALLGAATATCFASEVLAFVADGFRTVATGRQVRPTLRGHYVERNY